MNATKPADGFKAVAPSAPLKLESGTWRRYSQGIAQNRLFAKQEKVASCRSNYKIPAITALSIFSTWIDNRISDECRANVHTHLDLEE